MFVRCVFFFPCCARLFFFFFFVFFSNQQLLTGAQCSMPKESESQSMSGVLLSFSVFLFWLKERSKVLRKRSPFFFSSIASSQLFSSRIASLDAFFFASPCFAARGARLEDQVYVARRNVIKRNEFKKKKREQTWTHRPPRPQRQPSTTTSTTLHCSKSTGAALG